MNDESEFNPKGRRLCPDGSCVGLIGSDGRCGECGRVAGPAGAEIYAAADAESDGSVVEVETPSEAAAPASGEGAFDPKRRLCNDGSCVGVIGANGACNVCGKLGK